MQTGDRLHLPLAKEVKGHCCTHATVGYYRHGQELFIRTPRKFLP